MRSVLLIDNGSKRAASTLNLRRLAAMLSGRVGERVLPVSLLHSSQVPAARLASLPADTLEPTLRRQLTEGRRDFLLVPLFFGRSRALTQLVPTIGRDLSAEFGPFGLSMAPELCPLPAGEPRLVEILADNVQEAARTTGVARPARVVLVDHGSPIPEVNAVRRWLADRLGQRLGPQVAVEQAVMERRPGPEYDFNGELLLDALHRMAGLDPRTPVILAMLFLSAGRHAGPGGDIAVILERIEAAHPGFRAYPSPLVGSHPALIEILTSRLAESRPVVMTPSV